MEIGMLNFWEGLLVTALKEEIHFSRRCLFLYLRALQNEDVNITKNDDVDVIYA